MVPEEHHGGYEHGDDALQKEVNKLDKAVVTDGRLQPSFQQAPHNRRVFGSSTEAKYLTALARKVFMWTQS